MTVQNTKTVDFVSLATEPDTALLVISDHLDWSRSLDHQMALQEKLNSYLAYVESRELYTRFPKAEGKRIEIRVILQFPPDASGEQFLRKAEQLIKSAGFHFSWQVGIKPFPMERAN